MPENQEQEYQGPPPPSPTFYALQSQAITADLQGIVDQLEEVGSVEAGVQAAQILGTMATAAAILDLAHAVRQHGAAVLTALNAQQKKQGSSILQV